MYSLGYFELAVTSVHSCGRCVCMAACVHFFCTHTYTLCKIRFCVSFDKVTSKMCIDVMAN